jgi:hypothetical protein
MKLPVAAALGLTALTTTQLVAVHFNGQTRAQTEAQTHGQRLLHSGSPFAHVAGSDACGCPFCCGAVSIKGWAPEQVL